MIMGLEAYMLQLNASQLSNHGAVILHDYWVKVEWLSKSFTLDVQALHQCIHVLVREPALVRQLLSTFALSSLIPQCELGNFVNKVGSMLSQTFLATCFDSKLIAVWQDDFL
ncbi:TPA: hypothetical protein ACH3X1_001216 [Trebouxia sp. C0004]